MKQLLEVIYPSRLNFWLCSILCFCLISVQAFSLQTEKWQTANGAHVVFYETHDVPMLDIYIAFAAGSAYDGKAYGLSALTTHLLNQGNGEFNASQVAEKLEQTGAQFEVETSRDIALLHLRTLTQQQALQQATEAFALILNQPQFRSDAVYREKNQLLNLIHQNEDSPDEIANTTFFNYLYGEHPYAHSINGTQESVKNIQSWQVRNFYKRYFVANNATMVMVGAIDSAQAHALADQVFATLPPGTKADTIISASPKLQPEKITRPFHSTQTMIRLGQLGITHQTPEYFPLLLGNYVLGGGAMVSKLALEVREKQGLSYNVNSQLIPMPAQGPFIISLSTKNNRADQALAVTYRTLQDFLKNGLTEKELIDAKRYLSGSFSLSLASNNSIAMMLLRIAFYNLPDNYLDTYVAELENVNTEAVKKAFNHFIHPNELLQVTVGPS